jgi:hypothetical protein
MIFKFLNYFFFVLDGAIYNINWFKNMLIKIKRNLDKMADPLSLRKEFEV